MKISKILAKRLIQLGLHGMNKKNFSFYTFPIKLNTGKYTFP